MLLAVHGPSVGGLIILGLKSALDGLGSDRLAPPALIKN